MPKNSSTRFSKPSTSSFVDDGRDGKEVGNRSCAVFPARNLPKFSLSWNSSASSSIKCCTNPGKTSALDTS